MKRILALLLILCSLLSLAHAQEDDSFNWYEVFVYSYQDSNGDGIGDLNGLRNRLDYIEEMGYDGLWLMPIMPSPSYHKYDVMDYKAIDPQYGTLEDMRALVQACHERGIRIIIDLPVNHTSLRHPWFLNAAESLQKRKEDSPYIDYYHFSREQSANSVQLNGTKWYYEEQFSGGGMPDLNLDNEAVRNEILDIMTFWLSDVGVDGFRLDAVTSFYTGDTSRNVAFLNWMKATAESIKPGSYLVGEAWVGLPTIAEYYQSDIDSFFLFPASQAEGYIAKVIRSRRPAADYVKYMQQVEAAIPDGILAPFIGNHDTGRAVGSLQARQAPDRAKFAEGLVNLMGGNTFTYYGEEIGMVGSGDDPNKRLAMYWNDEDMTTQPPGVTKLEYFFPSVDEQLQDPLSLLNYCKALNHMKKKTPAIARGKNEFISYDNTTCLMKRTLNDSVCYIAVNFSAKATAQMTLPAENLAIISDLEVSTENASLSGETLTLPPYAIVILE